MILALCQEAIEYRFAAVCIPPCYIKRAAEVLYEEPVAIATVIGFPLGYQNADVKFFETHKAISTGATEIDVVMNLGALNRVNMRK
jgi:deoxyribose-phosphate aldolase